MITNRYNLPEHLIEMVAPREPVDKRYSVTELLNSVKEIILRRRYHGRIVSDLSDYVDMLFGTAFHSLMEQDEQDEIKLEHTFDNGVTVSGRVDRIANYEIIDYKTAKVYKVRKQDFSDWNKQGRYYAWLARKRGMYVELVRFKVFLKDYSRLRDGDLPQIYEYVYKVSSQDIIDTEAEILAKVKELEKYKNAHIDELPEPQPEELWYSGDKYAVVRSEGGRALKLFDDLGEAETYAVLKGANIELRKGEYIKLKYDEGLNMLFNMKEEK